MTKKLDVLDFVCLLNQHLLKVIMNEKDVSSSFKPELELVIWELEVMKNTLRECFYWQNYVYILWF